jgi:hypothetical protein
MRRLKQKLGFVLITSYLLVAVLLALAFAAAMRGAQELDTAERYRDLARTLHIAESALDDAVAQLRTGDTTAIRPTTLDRGTYSATITRLSPPTSDRYLIQSVGQLNGLTKTVEAVVENRLISPFQWGLFGIERVWVRGRPEVDSFNSARGSYEQTRGTNGDVATNATRYGSVDIGGAAFVNGDATVGPGGDRNRAIRVRWPSILTGERRVATSRTDFTPPRVPAGTPNRGHLRLRRGQVLPLSAGTYWYSSIKAEGGSGISASGPVTIYVDGQIKLGGRALGHDPIDDSEDAIGDDAVGDDPEHLLGEPVTVASVASNPKALKIYVTGNNKVMLRGRSRVYAAIYAPTARLHMRGLAELFGAAVAEKVYVKGRARVHYDEALADDGSSPRAIYKTSLLSWRER